MRFDLSDEEWAVLEPLMPEARKSGRADDRKIMNAIFYVLRTGMPWRDLPERYGPYTTAYNRFNRWSRRGIWKRIFDATFLLSARSNNALRSGAIDGVFRLAPLGLPLWPGLGDRLEGDGQGDRRKPHLPVKDRAGRVSAAGRG